MVESSTASAAAVLRARYPRTAASLDRYGGGTARRLERTGTFARFTRISVVQIGWALRRYRRETLRLVAEIGMGTGAMAVVGGTVAIIGFVTLSGGSLIAIQGFASLRPLSPVSRWPRRWAPAPPHS
ncbi:integral membrane protein YrbE2b [Mycobacterium tuberculosis]|nr:integral membrane protein YrbE2b [Mycobacterium tuberculosis]